MSDLFLPRVKGEDQRVWGYFECLYNHQKVQHMVAIGWSNWLDTNWKSYIEIQPHYYTLNWRYLQGLRYIQGPVKLKVAHISGLYICVKYRSEDGAYNHY